MWWLRRQQQVSHHEIAFWQGVSGLEKDDVKVILTGGVGI